jgi:hypothetical protein
VAKKSSVPPKGSVVVLVIGTMRQAVNKLTPLQTLIVILSCLATYALLKLKGALP